MTDEEKAIKGEHAAVLRKQCAHCAEVLPLKWCTGCRTVEYCSGACQNADWAKHKKVCKAMQRQRK